MKQTDDFSEYYQDLLEGRYDCPDRIVVNGYFSLGQQGGGFRVWWRRLTGSDETLDQEHILRLAGRFSRRVHAYAKRRRIPLLHCEPGVRKHELAEQHRPADPNFRGLFLILVAKAPALVWEVTTSRRGVPHLARKTPWPYVNHDHFHVIDKEWGHVTFKLSGHPPFGVQVMLNGHEWVERRAQKRAISAVKEGNCFVGGSDLRALDRLADALCDERAIGRVTEVCDRWVYSTCLCFALDREEQQRSGFRYEYSCFQVEYNRNLLFARGTVLEEVYQGFIDRTRRVLDVPTLKTIFGRRHRPHLLRHAGATAPRIERVLDESVYDLTVVQAPLRPSDPEGLRQRGAGPADRGHCPQRQGAPVRQAPRETPDRAGQAPADGDRVSERGACRAPRFHRRGRARCLAATDAARRAAAGGHRHPEAADAGGDRGRAELGAQAGRIHRGRVG
jgi:hypothetical protein